MDANQWFDIIFYGLLLFCLLDALVHVTKTMPALKRHRKTSLIDWLLAGPHQIKNIQVQLCLDSGIGNYSLFW